MLSRSDPHGVSPDAPAQRSQAGTWTQTLSSRCLFLAPRGEKFKLKLFTTSPVFAQSQITRCARQTTCVALLRSLSLAHAMPGPPVGRFARVVEIPFSEGRVTQVPNCAKLSISR